MTTPSDSDLVSATLAGSQEAYGDLVRRYERPILGLILRMVRNRALAEELSQDVFIKAYGRLSTYDRSRRFSSWLFKVAHNTAIDHLRKRQLDTVPLETSPQDTADTGAGQLADLLSDPEAVGPEERAVHGELVAAIERALGSMREDHREVLLLRFRHGLTYEELVEVTGLPLGTVKTHLFRARRKLAALLEEAGWM